MFILAAEMGEDQKNQGTPESVSEPTSNQEPGVGFPLSSPQPSWNGNKWAFIVLGLVVLLVAGGIFLLTRGSEVEIKPSPLPETQGVTAPQETPVPTTTPPPVDKSKIKVEIQNGTGISGEAVYLQGQLRNLGYSDIKAGNAASQNNVTTQVTFSNTVPNEVVNEVTAKLQDIYKEVDSKTSSTLKTDILVITGLRKGQTPRPSPTLTPTPTSSPTASPGASLKFRPAA